MFGRIDESASGVACWGYHVLSRPIWSRWGYIDRSNGETMCSALSTHSKVYKPKSERLSALSQARAASEDMTLHVRVLGERFNPLSSTPVATRHGTMLHSTWSPIRAITTPSIF